MSSFALGLLFGQMSVLIVLGFVVKFFLFSDSVDLKPRGPTSAPVHATPASPATLDSLLEQTYYDVQNHTSESMDWFTVLIAMVIRAMRQQATQNDVLLESLNRLVNSDKIPSFVGGIKITELHLGNDYPLLSNCKVVQLGEQLEVQFDIDLKDKLTLGIDTQLMLSYPKPMLACLPVSGSVSLINFSGRVRLSLKDNISLCFDPMFNMQFKIESLIGTKAQLQNVPKIGQLIESGLRKVFTDRCVEPNALEIRLPWPKPTPAPTPAPAQTPAVATAAPPVPPISERSGRPSFASYSTGTPTPAPLKKVNVV